MSGCYPPNACYLIQGWFWMKDNEGKYTVAEWYDGCWFLPGDDAMLCGEQLHDRGFSFVCECKEPVE